MSYVTLYRHPRLGGLDDAATTASGSNLQEWKSDAEVMQKLGSQGLRQQDVITGANLLRSQKTHAMMGMAQPWQGLYSYLKDSECAQIGVKRMAGTLGCTMDPPAATE